MAGPRPYPLAILLCDNVLVENPSDKRSLMGLFEVVRYTRLPVAQLMSLFLRITDAEGDYEMKVDYVHLSTDRLMFSESFPLQIEDRLAVKSVTVKLAATIDAPGKYEFRVSMDGAMIARTWFVAEPLTEVGPTQ